MKKIIAAIGALLLFSGIKAQDTLKVKKTTTPQVKTNKTPAPARADKNVKVGKTAFPKTTDSVASKTVKHAPAIKN